jgi:EsV-1-7 cysteine-rich motif
MFQYASCKNNDRNEGCGKSPSFGPLDGPLAGKKLHCKSHALPGAVNLRRAQQLAAAAATTADSATVADTVTAANG